MTTTAHPSPITHQPSNPRTNPTHDVYKSLFLRMKSSVPILLTLSFFAFTNAWTPSGIHHTIRRQYVVLQAGFGSGASSKKKKEAKLKPKQQWDRYIALKKEERAAVAVRVAQEWLEVGYVKSQDNKYTELAVARQRALIVDHAHRLFPLQVSSKTAVEWGYRSDDDSTFKAVDKSILDESAVSGLEKLVGFEGRPDPASGYYCYYNEGRLVNGDSESMRASSKKLQ